MPDSDKKVVKYDPCICDGDIAIHPYDQETCPEERVIPEEPWYDRDLCSPEYRREGNFIIRS